MQQLRAHVAVCRGWDLRPQHEDGGEGGGQHPGDQSPVQPGGGQHPGDHHTSRGRQRHRAEAIQIVPTANRMVIAKLLEKLQLHFPSFTTPS